MKQETWTAEQYQAHYQQEQRKKNNAPRLKYNNTPTVVDGIKFDSKKESQYYGRCKMLKLAGKITKIECHVPFPLIVNGVLICTYEADFVLYYPDGSVRVKDVKSAATEGLPVFRLKKALMLAIHKINVEIV
jgi:lipopolysaccharide assembly outer membrane protein LptD (OstA)